MQRYYGTRLLTEVAVSFDCSVLMKTQKSSRLQRDYVTDCCRSQSRHREGQRDLCKRVGQHESCCSSDHFRNGD